MSNRIIVSPNRPIMGENMATPDTPSDYLFDGDRALSARELAMNRLLSIAVDLWIEGDMDEATAIMKTADRYHHMTDTRFNEIYKEE